MMIFLMIIHVFVCLVLVFVVLLQAGRGGGLSDMVGAGQPQTLFGTQTNTFLTRATEVCAVVFILTSLSLGILTAQRGKSLVERPWAVPKQMVPPPAERRGSPEERPVSPAAPAPAVAVAESSPMAAETAVVSESPQAEPAAVTPSTEAKTP